MTLERRHRATRSLGQNKRGRARLHVGCVLVAIHGARDRQPFGMSRLARGAWGKYRFSGMANAFTNTWRLARAGIVLAQHGVRFVPKGQPVPLALRLARLAAL